MGSFCARCGRESDSLDASPDGSMLCSDCLIQSRPENMGCRSCSERYCGGVMACPFCTGCSGQVAAEGFIASVRKPILQPIPLNERCERCGGTLQGRAFILRGKALCRDCLLYEQERWEIVSSKPGKGGSRIRIVIEKPKIPGGEEYAKKLFHAIGADPENLPPDPFRDAKTLREKKMPDDSCVNCEAYAAGKKRGKLLGGAEGREAAESGDHRREK